MKKYNNLNESINSNNDTKMNIISDKEKDFNNSNVFIENIKILNTQRDLNQGFIQNETKITRKKQFIIYIPIVTLKIIIPCIFMLTYIIYSFENIEDQNYCKYSVIIFGIFGAGGAFFGFGMGFFYRNYFFSSSNFWGERWNL